MFQLCYCPDPFCKSPIVFENLKAYLKFRQLFFLGYFYSGPRYFFLNSPNY
jgi:hypothetical protein